MEFNEAAAEPAATPSRGAIPKQFDNSTDKNVSNDITSALVHEFSTSSVAVEPMAYIDDEDDAVEHVAIERPLGLNERIVNVLDHLDGHVEKFRRDAMLLQEKRDYLLMSIDLIKSNDLLIAMNESELDEIHTYIQRVNARLGTVELNVRTVRDTSQEDSLSQVNALIDMMITIGDPVYSRQRCQQYLNACCSSSESVGNINLGKRVSGEYCAIKQNFSAARVFGGGNETDVGPVDKKFESALLGCTLDDQKTIKKRLQALMDYLNKQTISSHTVETNASKQSIAHKGSSHNKVAQTSN